MSKEERQRKKKKKQTVCGLVMEIQWWLRISCSWVAKTSHYSTSLFLSLSLSLTHLFVLFPFLDHQTGYVKVTESTKYWNGLFYHIVYTVKHRISATTLDISFNSVWHLIIAPNKMIFYISNGIIMW